MKIAVCIKRVPVMDRRFTIAPGGTTINEAGLAYDVNDFDLWAVEAALRLKEQAGAGEVVVVSLGPDVVQEQIRKALSMGADRAIHLQLASVGADDLPVARALADALRGGGYDVIFLGRLAVDRANGVTGPVIAELLGLPCVTAVSKLEIAIANGEGGARGRAQRELEGAQEIIEFPLPAVVTVDQGLNTERLPTLKGIMAAKKKPLEVIPVTLDPPRVTVRQLLLPPERQGGRIIGDGVGAVPELVRLLHTEAKVL